MGRVRVVAGLACAALAVSIVAVVGPATASGAPADPGAYAEVLHELVQREAGPSDNQALQRGFPSAGAYRAALDQAAASARATAVADPTLAGQQWGFLGPVNIGGRITALALDPVHPGTVYIASASGGVWKTTDAGQNLTQLWPRENTQAIGALAMGSDGTLYAGTGEAGPGGGSLTYGGTGVYRSRDGGANWQQVGLERSGAIGRIVVAPGNPKLLYAAATGNLYLPGGQRGLYVSSDGGDSWKLSLAGANATTGAIDVVIDPTDPNRVFAAMWDHVRYPDLRVYGGAGSGLYRTTNGGTSWTRVTLGSDAPADVGRISIAVAPSLPSVVYALQIKTGGALEGFYRSVDGGASFTTLPVQDPVLNTAMTSYGWWFGNIAVDPVDPLRVIAGGLLLTESVDGGLTWTPDDATVHADQHFIAFDPTDPTRVYVGHDGGLSISTTRGIKYSHSPVAPFTQFSSVDVSQQDPGRVVGGAQDNGSLRSWGGSGWTSYGGGDGQRTLINYLDQNVVYACSQYGVCTYSTDGGNTNTSITGVTSSRKNWLTPIELDPVNPAVVYYGGNQLNRSSDGGKTWTVISPDLTGGGGRDPIYPNYGTITTIAAAPVKDGFIIVGTDDGRVATTRDGGAHWTRATDPRLPRSWVTRVAIDTKDSQTVYATFSGYRAGVHVPHVLASHDRGVTWSDISGDLPVAPVNKIVSLGGGLIVGTDVGVYLSRNGGGHWLRLGQGLPQAPVTDLRYQFATQSLYAATFGRGMWKVPLPLSLVAGAAATPVPAPIPQPMQLPTTSTGDGAAVLLVVTLAGAAGALRRRRRAS